MSENTAAPIQYVHVRTRINGIPQANGGYTLGVKRRPDGQLSVATAQCPNTVQYRANVGIKFAQARMKSGQYFVVANLEALQDVAQRLSDKIGTGTLVRISVEDITV